MILCWLFGAAIVSEPDNPRDIWIVLLIVCYYVQVVIIITDLNLRLPWWISDAISIWLGILSLIYCLSCCEAGGCLFSIVQIFGRSQAHKASLLTYMFIHFDVFIGTLEEYKCLLFLCVVSIEIFLVFIIIGLPGEPLREEFILLWNEEIGLHFILLHFIW